MALSQHFLDHSKSSLISLALNEFHSVREADTDLEDAESVLRNSVHDKLNKLAGIPLPFVSLFENAELFLPSPGILKELVIVITLVFAEFLHRTTLAVLAVVLQRKCVVDCWIFIHF